MFLTIIPDDISPDNRPLAEELAAYVATGLLPEQAAVGLLMRIPHVAFREDVVRRFIQTVHGDDDQAYSVVLWQELASSVQYGDVAMTRAERHLVLAACAIALPIETPVWHQIITGVDHGQLDLLVQAMYHAAGRTSLAYVPSVETPAGAR